MPDVQYISQGDKQILLIDLAGISDFQVVPALIDKAIQLAQLGSVPASVRTLLDLSGTRTNKEVISSLKSLSRNNGRYAKATAFVGLNKRWSALLSVVFWARRKRNHRVFSSRGEALRWLELW